MSLMGHERRFRAVRRVSAYPLTVAENQTVSNRSFGPKHKRRHSASMLCGKRPKRSRGAAGTERVDGLLTRHAREMVVRRRATRPRGSRRSLLRSASAPLAI